MNHEAIPWLRLLTRIHGVLPQSCPGHRAKRGRGEKRNVSLLAEPDDQGGVRVGCLARV